MRNIELLVESPPLKGFSVGLVLQKNVGKSPEELAVVCFSCIFFWISKKMVNLFLSIFLNNAQKVKQFIKAEIVFDLCLEKEPLPFFNVLTLRNFVEEIGEPILQRSWNNCNLSDMHKD